MPTQAWAKRGHATPNGIHPGASARKVLGECLTSLGKHEEAEELLLAAFEELKAAQGDHSQDLEGTRLSIMRHYESWGRPDKAREWRTSADQQDTPHPSQGTSDDPV